MILATSADVEARLRRELTDEEAEFIDGVLEEASALVEGYLGVTYTEDDTIPDVVALVVSRVAARALTAPQVEIPPGMSLGAGPFTISARDNSDLWLSRSDKLKLRNIGGGFTSVRLKSERR
jgi:hypothetical protein